MFASSLELKGMIRSAGKVGIAMDREVAVFAEAIKEHLVSEFGMDRRELGDDTPLFSSGHLDSFNLIDLVSFIEKRIGLRLRVADINLENLDTVSRMSGLVARTTAAKA